MHGRDVVSDRVDVEVDGYRVRVHIDGNSGPVVVLCSGLGGRQLHWSDTVADLARDHTVVRFDRPGTPVAGTPTLNARRTVRGEAARIAAALPSPKKRAVAGATGFTRRHGNTIARRSTVVRNSAYDACVYE